MILYNTTCQVTNTHYLRYGEMMVEEGSAGGGGERVEG